MAKDKTRMSEEASAAEAAALAERKYVSSEAAWDEAPGQEFGGKAEVVNIQVGEIAGPFTYVGHTQMQTDLGAATVHQATTKEGEQVRLPISATFVKAVDQAALSFGDTFLVRRGEDVEKKRGKGAGSMIPVYALKVLERVNKPAAPAAQ